MMSKELLKKAGILGVSFGLMASPLAFAQTDENSAIDENQGITADEQPMDPQGVGSSNSSDTDMTNDLTHDEGDDVSDMDPQSSSHSDDAEYGDDELVEENSGS